MTMVLLFGGSNQVEFSNELFALSWHDKRWTRVLDDEEEQQRQRLDQGAMPNKRHFHTAVVWPNPAARSFSSSSAAAAPAPASSADGAKSAKGKEKCREGGQDDYDAEGVVALRIVSTTTGKMFVFGGKSNGYFNDLWQFDPETNVWEEVTPDNRRPVKRYGHSAVVRDDEMWVFGGFDSDSLACSDLWSFHFVSKEWQRFEGRKDMPAPAGRFHHTAVYSRVLDRMFVFGGHGDANSILSDLWSFDFGTGKWEQLSGQRTDENAEAKKTLKKTKGKRNGKAQLEPSARYGHVALCDAPGESMIVMGGFDKCQTFTDLWQFRFATGRWQKWDMPGPAPRGTVFHAATWVDRLTLMTFGGRQGQSSDDVFDDARYLEIPQRMTEGAADKDGEARLMSRPEELIPDELLLLIFYHLRSDVVSLCQAASVCRRWSTLIMVENGLWEDALRSDLGVEWDNWKHYRDVPGGLRGVLAEGRREIRELARLARQHKTGLVPMMLVCVGDGAVGKTSTLISFATGAYPGQYIPTVFDNYTANVLVHGVPVSVTVWDFARSQYYDRQWPLIYPGVDVFVVCFSMVDRSSFNNVRNKWVPEITHHSPKTPFVLAGTKLDLTSGDDSAQSTSVLENLVATNQSSISHQEGIDLAREVGAVGFVACSSLMQHNIKHLLETCIKVVARRRSQAGAEVGRGGCVLS